MDDLFINSMYHIAFRVHPASAWWEQFLEIADYAYESSVPVIREGQLKEAFRLLSKYEYHMCSVVALETDANRLHFQGYIGLSNFARKGDHFRDYLKKCFQIEKGTGQLSATIVKNKEDYKKYIIKEGNWLSSNMDVQDLMRYQKIAYPKKKNFRAESDEIEIRYLEGSGDIQSYISDFIKLKVKYRQGINASFIKARAKMLMCKRDESQIERISKEIAKEILSDFNLGLF